ncbi:peroxide stress protein YaaA [Aliarcobacter skirrowii]|uniref:peroxide stress protein YaaA n=1 Tax=Aliarcobacter skirrowii TaxID=28200 RepID=UPI000F664F63|nr:peroxide stress protein YaaA [Aliarcobacter skirrowii]AZL54793.1 peroxide stress protein YaaA [Aliarcobacter skirrowii]
MKILFSPSETKISGGDKIAFSKDNFIFPELFNKRAKIVKAYNDFLKTASKSDLEKLFGTKKDDVIEKYRVDIFSLPLKKAIQRYEGVAYDYLNYNNLDKNEQNYIDENVLIFSNIFGVIKASDLNYQ